MKPIFVSVECLGYSGATLLSFLLDSHPEIASIGEMDGLIAQENPDEYLCSCGERIKECPFWNCVGKMMQEKGFAFDIANFNTRFTRGDSSLGGRLRIGSLRNNFLDSLRDATLRLLPQEKRRIDCLVDRNVALAKSVLEVTNKKVFVDTSKDYLKSRYIHKYSEEFDVRIIHLVRDVRGYVASCIRRSDLHSSNAELTAKRWVKENRKHYRTGQIFPSSKYLVIRYEDLCLNTDEILKKIYRFCDADDTVHITDFMAVLHHIIGNKMRLRSSSEIKLDKRWQTLLSREQLTQISNVAGDLSRQLGYSTEN